MACCKHAAHKAAGIVRVKGRRECHARTGDGLHPLLAAGRMLVEHFDGAFMPGPAAFEGIVTNAVPPGGVSCKVLRGRRKEDTDWLVIRIEDGDHWQVTRFDTETDARLAAERFECAPQSWVLDTSDTANPPYDRSIRRD